MPKSLSQLRVELATRLGFGSQLGAEIIQAPLLESFLQRAQESIIDEFGSQIGSTVPAADFTNPNDLPSVPERPLLLMAIVAGKVHYGQKPDSEVTDLQSWEASIRGFAA